MRRLFAVAVSMAVAFAAPVGAAARLPTVLTQDQHHPFVVRPATISYTGDGTGVVGGTDGTSVQHPGHLHWTLYNNRQGAASGAVWLNDCDPSCAGGEFSAVPVTVHVFSPKHGRFTRLTLQFTYQRKHYVDRRAIRHIPGSNGVPGYWVYYILDA
jgi:hypothetical protein